MFEPVIASAAGKFAVTIAGDGLRHWRLRRRVRAAYIEAAAETIDSSGDPASDTWKKVVGLLGDESKAWRVAALWRQRAYGDSGIVTLSEELSEPVHRQIRRFVLSLNERLLRVLPDEHRIATLVIQSTISPLTQEIRALREQMARAKPVPTLIRYVDRRVGASQTPDAARLSQYSSSVTVVGRYEQAGPRLTRYVNRRVGEKETHDADLLSPYAWSIPVVGRADELESLRGWMSGIESTSIRVLIGRGGVGKTRLALELCDRAAAEGWDAGFIPRSDLDRFLGGQPRGSWNPSKPTLVVVDYAASRAKLLRGWFSELADRADGSGDKSDGRLRVLLLERFADPDGGWWIEAFGRGGGDAEAVQRLLDPDEPVALPDIRGAEDRRRILAAIMERAGAETRPPAAGDDPLFDERLAKLDWASEPLFLMMAGLTAAESGVGQVLTLSRIDLAFRMADQEIGRVEALADKHGVNRELLSHMVAYATLCQGLTDREARDSISEERHAWSYEGSQSAVVLQALKEALPAEGGGVGQVLPDMVGEAVLLKTLRGLDDDASAAAVSRATQLAGARAVATIVRSAQDYAKDSSDAPVVWLERLIDEASGDLAGATAMADLLPEDTVALRGIAASLQVAIVRLARDVTPREEDHESRPLLAKSLNNVAVRLSDVGKREVALEAAQEAADIYRELAAERPNAFRADLAMSLNNLANRLGDVGKREVALAVAHEATDIYRELAADRPDSFRPNLATSLNNLASHLSNVGKREAALEAAQEAADIRRELAAFGPHPFRPDLATSLNNLANRLGDVGKREAALAAAQEAADIRRELAADRPDAFRPDLATSLDNLANHLSDVGKREAALAAAQEATDIRRELAADRPDAFRPDLATSLNNLANQLSNAGKPETALEAAQEAADIRRELAAERPDAFRPNLATSLDNLASRLSNVGKREAALEAAQEGADIYRELAAERPDAFRANLAISLNTLANRLSEAGKQEAALQAAQEAAGIYRELAADRPEAFRSNLAGSLNNLANRLSEARKREAALEAAQEGADIYDELAADQPDAFRPDLAKSLNNLANRLSESGRSDEALDAAREAVAVLTPQYLAHRTIFRQLMSELVDRYASRCQELDREPEATLLDAVIEALKEDEAPA